jgi:DNA-binding HxlR family transcriptional regulator
VKWERLHREPCPVAQTISVIGDRWTMLVLRDCFLGIRRFEAFQDRLGISRTIITDRLNLLVQEGVLRRDPYQERPVRHEYRLTPKGLELYPILISMVRWGNTHYGHAIDAGAAIAFRHKTCGKRFRPALTCEACGEAVEARDVEAFVRER